MKQIRLVPEIKNKTIIEMPELGREVKLICLSENADWYTAHNLIAEANKGRNKDENPLSVISHKPIADRLIVTDDGKRSENCDVLQREFNISDFFSNQFGHPEPGKPFGDIITREYDNGQIRRIEVPKEIRDLSGNILVLRDGLIPGEDYSIVRNGDVYTLEYDFSNLDKIWFHGLPVEDGWYPTDIRTGIPTSEIEGEKGPKRYLYRFIKNSAVSALVRRLCGYGSVDLGIYDLPRGVLAEERR